MNPRVFQHRLILLCALSFSAGCSVQKSMPGAEPPSGAEPGYAAPPGAAPAPESEQVPSSLSPSADEAGPGTLEEAEAALNRADRDLEQVLGGQASGTAGGAAPLSQGAPRCLDACKAFSSLRRAADAVCRLAGDSDERCTKARELVDANQKKVAVCACAEDAPE